MTKSKKIENLSTPTTEEGFRSQSALAQYIVVNCRPDVCAAVQLIAPGSTKVEDAQFKSLGKAVPHLKETKKIGFDFVKLDIASVCVVVWPDASFAKAIGMKSQLGFVNPLPYGQKRAYIDHYGFNRCHRLSRSIMAAEVHALVHAFDNGFVVQEVLEELLGRRVELEAFVDSRTLFNVIANNSCTAERRLQIYMCTLREAFRKAELQSTG